MWCGRSIRIAAGSRPDRGRIAAGRIVAGRIVAGPEALLENP